MTTNNQFLKQIAERVTDTEITGTHSDNYYLNLIATTVCNKTYTGVQCNGKYVKDIAEVICATTYTEQHFNNYYYRRMALEYVSTLEHTNDNYLLGVIAENIVAPTILFDGIDLSLTDGKDILSYKDVTANTEYAVVTAQLTNNGSSVSISGVPVVFGAYDSSDNLISGSEQSVDTDNTGKASYTYTSQGRGDVTIKAVPDNRILLTKTFVIQDCSLYRANPVACTSCNIDLPSSALVSYKMSKPILDSTSGGVNIQLTDASHTYFVGNWASAGNNGILIRNTGSSTNLINETCSDITANTEYTLGVTYDNGDWTYFKDDEVKSFTANYTPTKISIIQIQQGTMKDLIIKPL